MKFKLTSIITVITIILLPLIIILGIWKTNLAISTGNSFIFSDIWVAPILSLFLFILLTYFINNPKFLVKKTLAEIENQNHQSGDAIQKWKIIYYYLRLILIVFIGVLYLMK
ncbi:MAG: hypothetical protein C4330_12605 [Chitinophagaceae bacterium]